MIPDNPAWWSECARYQRMASRRLAISRLLLAAFNRLNRSASALLDESERAA